MTEFEGHKSALVGDIDCTAAGKPLCDSNGIKGFPTIKHGDPNNMEDYKGGRDFDSLKKFADENLKPSCSPDNVDLCDADQKATIEKYQAMSDSELEAVIAEGAKAGEDAEATFKSEVEKLQKTYEGLQKAKEDTLAKIKSSGLGYAKAVKSSKK